MALDFLRVISQIEEMTARLRADEEEGERRVRLALECLHSRSGDIDSLNRRIQACRTTWLVAGLVDGLDRSHKPPSLPQDFGVLAADGSHIDVDRNHSVRCCLINIGNAFLRFGNIPDAVLESEPTLYSGDEDLVVADPQGSGQGEIVTGGLLGIKRSLEECRSLVARAKQLIPELPVLCLLDGTLILWGLEAYPDYVTQTMLSNGLLKCLDEIEKIRRGRSLAVASYVSFSRSTDVVNALRVALCPHESVDCDRNCPGMSPVGSRECDAVAGVRDSDLFSRILKPGERSSTFISRSPVVQKYYREHEVWFFYLNVEDEIARIEFPRWVAEDRSMLDLVHALVLDQCSRGHGYPVALSEAHERAVVNAVDREQFWELVHTVMAEKHIPFLISAKSRSKRARWI